jgi:hypothetical protein
MILRQKDEIRWLQFELLADCSRLKHGVFLRPVPFDSLHSALEIPSLFAMNQVHGATIVHVDQTTPPFPQADGLITEELGMGLMGRHADCQVAIFYDPVQHRLAVVHAGWRGQVAHIYTRCIQKMGSRPENLLVCISPSLGPTHAEFRNYKMEFPPAFWDFKEGECHFNLWSIARAELLAAGVLPCHIEIAERCTYSDPDAYFSYRRDKSLERNGTVACLT